jgi:hypothetical protein
MTRILVPTDFKAESAKIIDAIALQPNFKEVTIIFLHAFKLSDSISNLLMLNRRSRDYENVSDDFYKKIDQYTVKYKGKVKAIGIEFFYGSTAAAFKNLMEGLKIDLIVYAQDYNFNPINKYSIDPKYLTLRSGCEVLELDTLVIAQDQDLFDTKMRNGKAQRKVMSA